MRLKVLSVACLSSLFVACVPEKTSQEGAVVEVVQNQTIRDVNGQMPTAINSRVLTLSYKCRFTDDVTCDTPSGGTEGSGPWGAQKSSKKPTDNIAHSVFSRIADAADAKFKFKMAAKHLRHYLKNSGVTLFLAEQELGQVQKTGSYTTMDRLNQKALTRANVNYDIARRTASLKAGMSGKVRWKMGGYFDQSDSKDLFFAIGGHHVVFIADYKVVSITGDEIKISVNHQGLLKDNYNWDSGKSVQVLDDWCENGDWCEKLQDFSKLTIEDKDLGRLHKVGLAKEFLVVGHLPARTYQWSIKKSTLKSMSKGWENVLRCYESTEQFSKCD